MTSKTITGIVTWLKGWFYTKDEITTKENALQTQINNKASQSDLNTLSSTVNGKLDASDYVVDSALSSSSTNPVQNKVINTALLSKANLSDVPVNTSDLANDGVDGINSFVSDDDSRLSDARTPISHTHSSADVTEATALSHIGTSANATQSAINSKLDTIVGNLTGADILKVVTTLPTASVSTQNALYLLKENEQYDIYITIEDNGSYSWEKLDDDVLSDLSIAWGDITGKPSSFIPTSHNSKSTTYGVGDNMRYGHNIVIDNLDESTHNIGYSLSAHQGYVLKGLIDAKSDFSGSYTDLTNIPSTFTPSSHTHGQITDDGKITRSSVAIASGDNILITDASDSSIVKRVDNILSSHVRHSTGLPNIGTNPNALQSDININVDIELGAIDISLNGKASKSEVIDWDTLTFVAKADDETGAITFDYLE